jgi:Ras-related GTP-binding protein A/B
MDKILLNKKQYIFEEKKQEIIEKISKYNNSNIKFYPTSIWDGSLYIPWREIMSDMVKNINIYIKGLNYLLEACDADEIFLFERNTFLSICSVNNGINKNSEERTKKISFLIKKLNQALSRNKSNFSCLKLKLNNIMVYFEEFSKYSYIMILSQKPKINYNLLSLNICILRQNFEKYFNCKLLN